MKTKPALTWIFTFKDLLERSEKSLKAMAFVFLWLTFSPTVFSQSALLIYDVNSTATQALKTALQNAGISVTLSSTAEDAYNGTNPSPNGFSAVIHLNGTTYTTDMPLAGQDALVNYVNNLGGTYISGEWDSYEFQIGHMQHMRDLILMDRYSGETTTITYTTVAGQANHPVLTNIPSSFSFFAGTSPSNLHSFATQAATTIMTDQHNTAAVAVRNYGSGRVVYFNHAGNYSNPSALTDANIQRLYINGVLWSNNALSFDGVNDFVSAPLPMTVTTNLTLEAWIYPTSFANQYSVPVAYGFDNGSVGDGTDIFLNFDSLAIHHPGYGLVNCGYKFPSLNQWYHIAVVRTGSTTSAYVNGVLQPRTFTGPINTPSEFRIGSQHGIRFFPGRIDEVRIWDRALCQGEIENNMHGEINPHIQSGLKAYYRFDQGIAGGTNTGLLTLVDSSGSALNLNGTLNNFALTGATSNWVQGITGGTVAAYVPTATITPSGLTTFCAGGSVTLNASSGTGYTYQWQLNGSPIGGATSATYVASASGSYTVVENQGGCVATSSPTIVTVNTVPAAAITAGGLLTFCAGGTVTLNANTGVGLTYQWKLNGSNISGATSSSYIAGAGGSYTVTVTGAGSCSATSSAAIVTVNPLPTASVMTGQPTTFCSGGSVTLNANTGAGLSYQWKLGGSDITGATGSSYSATASGNYSVTVTNINSCNATSSATTVTVNPLPSANISAIGSTIFCAGGSVALNANTGTGLSYQWKLNGSDISGATASSYIANASGSYSVNVTNSNNCQASSLATTVTVNALPTVTASNLGPVCVRDTIKLFTSPGSSYAWSGPNSFASSGQTPVILDATTAMAGIYTAMVTDENNCSASATTTVVVNELPTPTATSNSPVCVGGTINLSATGGTSYFWSGPNSFSDNSTATPSISNATMAAAGHYVVKVTGSNGCRDTASTDVIMNISPAAAAASNSPLCSGATLSLTSSGGVSYAWTGPNGFSSSQQNPSILNAGTAATGTYTVTVTTASSCISTATATVVVGSTPSDLSVSTASSSVCPGGSTNVNVSSSESLVQYTLRNNANNATVAGPVSGNGGTLSLSTGALASSTTFNVLAVRPSFSPGLHFNGSSGYAENNSFILSNPSAGFTIEGWINIDDKSKYHTIATQTRNNFPAPFDMYVVPTSGAVNFLVGANNVTGAISTSATVTPGVWTHLAFVYDPASSGSQIKIYMNGVLAASGSAAVPANVSGSIFRVANRQDNVTLTKGSLDEVRIWNVPRTAAQISGTMSTCLTGNENGLVVYYPMNEGTGTTINDLAATGGTQNSTFVNLNPATAWVNGTSICAVAPACNLQLSQTAAVTVNSAPVFTSCPSDISTNVVMNSCAASVSYSSAATGTPAPSLSYSFSGATTGSGSGTGSGASFNKGITTVTITATNTCGSSFCTFTVTVNDNIAPVVTTSAGALDASIQCSNASGLSAALATAPVATDNCTASPTIHLLSDVTTQNTACANGYTRVRTWNFTDASNNTSESFVQTITLIDNTAPVVSTTAASLDHSLQCSNASGIASALDEAPTATDNCTASPTIHLISDITTADETCANAYVRVRTWNFTDGCGNTSANFVQRITVIDNTAPVVSTTAASLDHSLQCSNASGIASALAEAPTATDNCTASPTIHLVSDITTADETCANAYVRVRTWNFTDGCGNTSANFVQRITVIDNTAPVVSTTAASLDHSLQCSNASGIASALGEAPTATDNCTASPTIHLVSDITTADETCANAYVRVRTWNFIDGCGNTSANFVQRITVIDNTAPVVTTTAGALNHTLLCSNATAIASALAETPAATDNCTTSPTIHLVSDVTTLDANCANAYIRVRTWNFTDGCGNTSSSFTQSISVYDNVAPTVSGCPANMTLNTGSGNSQCGTTVTWTEPSATDNCSGSITYASRSHAPGSFFAVGTTTVTYNFSDGCGNSTACSFTVTVVDNTPPVASCRNATVTLVNGAASITAADINNGSSDACGIQSVTVSPTSFNCSNLGSNPVVLTVRDIHNNVSTCQATVTVNGSAPTCSISVTPSTTTYTGGNPRIIYLGYGPQSVTLAASASNGAPFSYAWTGSDLSAYNAASTVFSPTTAGTYTFTCTITNSYGCTGTCSVTICVMDIRDPSSSPSNQKVYLCHVPPGNPNNPQSLSISTSAVPAHLGLHTGDRLGTCSQSCGLFKTQAPEGHIFSEGEVNLLVYPNPSASTFNFSLESASDEPMLIRLYDMTGREVFSSGNLNSKEIVAIGESLVNGAYIAEVIQGDFRKTVKINKIQ
jgi:hypothetical protein